MPSRRLAARSEPISRTDVVAHAIRQQLIAGQLRAGQRLSEVHLAQQHDISRNTLREVFRILIKEGLLRHEPNKGVSVVVPSIADIIDIYRVRRLIECPILEKAWPLHPAHKRMQQAVQDAKLACEIRDWQRVASNNMAFHAAIVALGDSVRLSAMFEDISAELRLAFGMLDDPEYLHAPYATYNARLLEMFMTGDSSAAARELEIYLMQSERMVLSVYSGKLP